MSKAVASHQNAVESPFEQVRIAEEREQARVEKEKHALEQRTLESLRRIEAEKVEQAERVRAEKRDEIKAFAATEPAAILTKAQAEADRLASEAGTAAQRGRQAIEADLCKKVLTGSFLSHDA